MKAVLYRAHGGPEVLEYTEVADPAAAAGEVLVRLQAACVAPFDWKLRQGILQEHFRVDFPSIPGRDGAGVIEAVGAGVDDLAVGDPVCVLAGDAHQGTYAELIALPRRNVAVRPPSLTAVQAVAGLNPGVNALTCLDLAEVGPCTRVLVHGGSGAVGGILVQLCRGLGAHVTATCRAANEDYVLGLGAHEVVPYDSAVDFGALRGIDVVFDVIGGQVHDRSYAVLRPGGTLVYLHALPIVDRGAEFGVTVVLGYTGADDDPATIARVLALAGAGAFVPQVAGSAPLAHAVEAHRRIESGGVTRGRLVLTME